MTDLNRADRRHLKSIQKETATMTIDLKANIEAHDADDTIIYDDSEKKTLPTLGKIAKYAMAAAHQSDQGTGFKEKNERGLLVRRIRLALEGDGLIELVPAERELIKKRIGLFMMQADLITVAGELLDKDAAAPKEARLE